LNEVAPFKWNIELLENTANNGLSICRLLYILEASFAQKNSSSRIILAQDAGGDFP
jgi:hypothetical protein